MPNPDDIKAKVDKFFIDNNLLMQRMDDDYDLWSLEPYTGAGSGFKSYTSNEPRTYGKKNVTTLSGAQMTIRSPQDDDNDHERSLDNAKERFLIGNFRANDARLAKLRKQQLRPALSWAIPIRGSSFGRAMLMKQDARNGSREKVWADATPWDAREVAFGMGRNGLAWICHRHSVSRADVEAMWGKHRFAPMFPGEHAGTDMLDVYDYYDEEINQVDIPGLDKNQRAVKSAAIHGMIDGFGEPSVPAWASATSIQPMVITPNKTWGQAMAQYAESIYAENRGIWPDQRFLLSVMLELAARSRKPFIVVKTRDGIKTLEVDPFKEGLVLPLAEGEEIILPDMLRSSPDMGPLLSIISGEMQRGGLPSIEFGENFQNISGFAMQTLRSTVSGDIKPLAETKAQVLTQISNLWVDHFMTGAFTGDDGMQLSGQGSNRRWFSFQATPDLLRDLPEPIIMIRPQLPQDDAGRMQMAQMARQPGANGLPLLADQDILEDILEYQDSDLMIDKVYHQLGNTMHPEAFAATMTIKMIEREDPKWVIYYTEWQKLAQARLGQGAEGGMQVPGGGNAAGGGGGGLPPEVAPNATLGVPPPTPGVETPGQQGPVVPPGSPRRSRNGTRPVRR